MTKYSEDTDREKIKVLKTSKFQKIAIEWILLRKNRKVKDCEKVRKKSNLKPVYAKNIKECIY